MRCEKFVTTGGQDLPLAVLVSMADMVVENQVCEWRGHVTLVIPELFLSMYLVCILS